MVDNSINRKQIVEVVWQDVWISPEKILSKDRDNSLPVLRSAMGYVISKDNEECLILSTDLYEQAPGIVNTPMVIPWDSIIEWYEFQVH